MTDEDDLKTLTQLIRKFRFAMVTTMETDGSLVAHPLTVQEAEFDGDLWFVIGKDAPAAQHLARNPHAGVSMSSDDAWVSLSGTGRIVEDRAKLAELWKPALEAWFPNGKDDPNVGLLHFTADGAEFWHSPGSRIVHLVTLLTRRKIEGENEKLDL
ncbi:pyridoxamine 5'-phosphate oxidase [Microbacterium caowuchunii]|uniref:pyridoxamine 5'-phosphate oxidase family protein n=1 Tax=Microbacterium caowuchunii TaxID=2614638 RepID=UPI0012476B9A|nr:pyridoxamine 5'-phosphate oxidase family protein [Microbacterium caowuchunii]QEW00893.1 pyridoxamine 5'-phosphate oxidase [Microbacterium caowuchunii]